MRGAPPPTGVYGVPAEAGPAPAPRPQSQPGAFVFASGEFTEQRAGGPLRGNLM